MTPAPAHDWSGLGRTGAPTGAATDRRRAEEPPAPLSLRRRAALKGMLVAAGTAVAGRDEGARLLSAGPVLH